MYFEPTAHYELNSTGADVEWASLTPYGGVVLIGPNREPNTISMFHQLRCLDVIRRSYNAREALTPEGPSPAALHCLQYVRIRKPVIALRLLRGTEAVPPVALSSAQYSPRQ